MVRPGPIASQRRTKHPRPRRSAAKSFVDGIVLCKTIVEERGQQTLGQRERYHFYVTNDLTMSAEDIVREANDRCNQENVLAQLKGGVRALRAPLNTLNANWAYMVIASIAWSLKAWFALSIPVSPRWRAQHEADRQRILRMEFRSFVNRAWPSRARTCSTTDITGSPRRWTREHKPPPSSSRSRRALGCANLRFAGSLHTYALWVCDDHRDVRA